MSKNFLVALAALPLTAITGMPLHAATPPPVRPQPVRPPATTVIPRPKPSQPIAAQQAGNLSFYTKPQTGVAVFQTRVTTTAAPLIKTTTDITPASAPVVKPTIAAKPTVVAPVTRPVLTRPTTDLR